jgi:hypothetical protein
MKEIAHTIVRKASARTRASSCSIACSNLLIINNFNEDSRSDIRPSVPSNLNAHNCTRT